MFLIKRVASFGTLFLSDLHASEFTSFFWEGGSTTKRLLVKKKTISIQVNRNKANECKLSRTLYNAKSSYSVLVTWRPKNFFVESCKKKKTSS